MEFVSVFLYDSQFLDVKLKCAICSTEKRSWLKFFDEYEYRDLYERRGIKHKWWNWYDENDTPEERRYIAKLDLLITSYCFVSYWNITDCVDNAYVSGMKDDLNLGGNDLVHLQVMYTLGVVIFELPFMYLFSKVRMNWLIPGMDIVWGFFTLAQYRAKSQREMMAYRFLIGSAEGCFFPGVHYVLGSWFKSHELQRCGGIFYFGLMLGSCTTGLLQAAVYKHLNGYHGLAGWRWMFAIDAIITIPVGILGFFVWPGTPEKVQSFFLTEKDLEISRRRANLNAFSNSKGFSWSVIKKACTSWHLPVIFIWNTFFFNSGAQAGTFLLWLQSLGTLSKPMINNLSAIPPALGIFFVFVACFGADVFRSRWFFLCLAQAVNFTGLVILAVWNVPDSAKWYAFMVQYAAWSMSSVLYGWVNDILRHDNEYRSILITGMTIFATQSTAWTPLIFWKTTAAPRYRTGYIYASVISFCLIIWTFVVLFFFKRDERNYYFERLHEAQASDDDIQDHVNKIVRMLISFNENVVTAKGK
ncbi:major facilitator superfamily domain-containing protein [Lipomyces japonicus]|uniref:major facilitator superfamily domain-containing protein n=1 Tax=Lipomyces japonicus TaxID=56871 RepID=UPI0034CD1175